MNISWHVAQGMCVVEKLPVALSKMARKASKLARTCINRFFDKVHVVAEKFFHRYDCRSETKKKLLVSTIADLERSSLEFDSRQPCASY